jgi:hypothetical protein
VRMLERRRRARFAVELIELIRFIPLRDFLRQDFERDVAFEGDIFGAKNFSHRALAEDGNELEVPDHPAFPRRRRLGDIDPAGRAEGVFGTAGIFVGQRRLQCHGTGIFHKRRSVRIMRPVRGKIK